MGMHLSFGLETLDNGNILVRGHMYCKKDSRLEEDIQAVQTLIHEDCEKLLVNGPGELDELAGLPVYMFFSDKIDPSVADVHLHRVLLEELAKSSQTILVVWTW